VVILIVFMCSLFVCQDMILSKALKAQKDAEDESCRALGNLRSEVITLRNKALEKDKILLSLVERLKSSKARLSTQAETHEADMQELKKKVAKATENFNVEVARHEIGEIERSRTQKNVDELRAAKEKCYEIAMECAKNLKNNFSKVGAFSSEQKFIRGKPDEVIQWINGKVEAFEEILSDRGDFCAFAGAGDLLWLILPCFGFSDFLLLLDRDLARLVVCPLSSPHNK
jgi:chromosome segregation ATPase